MRLRHLFLSIAIIFFGYAFRYINVYNDVTLTLVCLALSLVSLWIYGEMRSVDKS